MASTFQATGVNVKVLLNNGSTQTGSVKTISVGIGGSSQKLKASAYITDLENARNAVNNICDALTPIFAKSVYELDEITTGKLLVD